MRLLLLLRPFSFLNAQCIDSSCVTFFYDVWRMCSANADFDDLSRNSAVPHRNGPSYAAMAIVKTRQLKSRILSPMSHFVALYFPSKRPWT